MTGFILVPGAGGSSWYWHLVADGLRRRGHDAVAVELPGADPIAGLSAYRELIVRARAVAQPRVIVAQSLGGFSAPLACADVSAGRLVLVNAMIPAPGESAGSWWEDVGWSAAAQASADRDGRPPVDPNDIETIFFHDVPPDIADTMRSDPSGGVEAEVIFGEPWPLDAWPDVPTTVLTGRDDRLFPPELQAQVARERLGLDVELLPGGHLMALSQPGPLIDALTR